MIFVAARDTTIHMTGNCTALTSAKSNKSGKYFVANLSQIPIEDKSIDTAVHLFAPFNDREFARILKDDGNLYSVIPGENHLIEMKELLYDVPYKNDEKAPDSKLLQLVEREKVSEKVHISSEDLFELFSMTHKRAKQKPPEIIGRH